MDINKEIILSSILKNKETLLFELNLPGIKRQFESICYSFNGISKQYGELCDKFISSDLDNTIVGISTYNGSYIICFIDLKNLTSKYFFVKNFDSFKVNIKKINYQVFIYTDLDNKLLFETNYKGNDFSFDINKNNLIINNTIFDSEVLSHSLNLNNELAIFEINNAEASELEYLDVADFFIYKDSFIKNDINNFVKFSDFLNLNSDSINLQIKNKLNLNEFFPLLILNLRILKFDKSKESLLNFRKILLSFFGENIACYLIDSIKIEGIFSENFQDFTHLKINELNLDFNIPDNIFNFSERYDKLRIDLLKLRYNLFLLKQVQKYKDNDNSDIEGKDNIYYKLSEKRLSVYYNDIDEVINNYEKELLKLLEVINLKFI